MNPMIRKELRQRMRERKGWILPSLYLFVLSAVVVMAYYGVAFSSRQEVQGSEIGVVLFFTTAYAQLALLLLLVPIFSAGALTIEKEQRTLAGLLTSLLRPVHIWWGKFIASLLFVLLLLVAGLPVVSTAFAFGGIGPWEVFMMTLTTLLILAAVSANGLYWSSAFRRSVHATAVTYVTVVALTVVTFVVFFVATSLQGAHNWNTMRASIKIPLYFNPIFFLTMAFAPPRQLYPEWATCALIFFSIALLSFLFTLRNLRRGGEGA
jgi:ABC-type transport system involved in multi-copper enzyme maturation permease subunit